MKQIAEVAIVFHERDEVGLLWSCAIALASILPYSHGLLSHMYNGPWENIIKNIRLLILCILVTELTDIFTIITKCFLSFKL